MFIACNSSDNPLVLIWPASGSWWILGESFDLDQALNRPPFVYRQSAYECPHSDTALMWPPSVSRRIACECLHKELQPIWQASASGSSAYEFLIRWLLLTLLYPWSNRIISDQMHNYFVWFVHVFGFRLILFKSYHIDLLLIRPATVSRLSAYKSLDCELQFMVPASGSRLITSD